MSWVYELRYLLTLALTWCVLGILCVLAIEYAARSSKTKGPLSQNSLGSALAYVAALMFGAPFILVFAFVQSLLILWRGTIPITGKNWWPARAKKFGAKLVEESDESTLCSMIELRRKIDRKLRRQPHPSHVPVFQLWRTPEHVIYFVSRCAALLQHDGCSEAQALRRVDCALRLGVLSKSKRASSLEEYLWLLLATRAPEYLAHGPGLLRSALDIARARIADVLRYEGTGYPPADWLTSRLSAQEFIDEWGARFNSTLLIPTTRFDSDLAEFLVRWQEGDELWRFSSPTETWRMMMGRGGIALVRGGRPITHIETVMN